MSEGYSPKPTNAGQGNPSGRSLDVSRPGAKKPVPIWRTVVSIVVLLAVLGAAVWVFWGHFVKPATITLTVLNAKNFAVVEGATVRVDDSKVKVPDLISEVTLDLRPGKHKIEISKEGFETFTKEYELKSGDSETLTAPLEPLKKK